MNASPKLSFVALVAWAGSALAQENAPRTDPVVPPPPPGTPAWYAGWTGDARLWWRERLRSAAVVIGARPGRCRPRGRAFEDALPIKCGVLLAGLTPGTRRSEVEALLRPLGGRVETFPRDAYAEAVVRLPSGTEPAAALRLVDDTTRVRYVSFDWIGTLPSGPVPKPPVAGLVEHVVEGVTVRLTARRLVAARGDSVRFVAAARNSTRQWVRLTIHCGPPMDVVVTGPDGYRVWLLSELLGPHGTFPCGMPQAYYAKPGAIERHALVWRAPNRPGAYTAVAGLRGGSRLTHLSAPVRIIVR